MENRVEERFFKELAQAYAEREGMALVNELTELKRENTLPHSAGLKRKIKNKLSYQRFRNFSKVMLPLAASFLVALFFYTNYGNNKPLTSSESLPAPAAPATSAPIMAEESVAESDIFYSDSQTMQALYNSVELVSASLPAGYYVSGVDYDNAAAIMEIISLHNNRIVLVTEAYHEFNNEGFSEILINGDLAYTLVKSDYCLLKYAKNDMLYSLSGLYEYGDLIEIVENI